MMITIGEAYVTTKVCVKLTLVCIHTPTVAISIRVDLTGSKFAITSEK